ncbi:hypothetical protein [Parasediminibacterium sp. JCM 36343]|uniref:hypothetical protein n=1 Tax=Parasediminibacterium sp. JCM 36343 TaxID=3374279 RepID=UPI00397A5727
MKYSLLVLLTFMLFSCKHKKTDLSGTSTVKAKDFIAAFAPITLPYTLADTNINSLADTIAISHVVLSQFVPDSILTQLVNTDAKFDIHPAGRIDKEKEIYLLLNITQKKKTQVAVLVFNKENKFLAGKSLLADNANDGYVHSLSINREPTFVVSKEKTNAETKQLQFSRVGWVYNTAGVFMVVINDNNEDPKKDIVINPIDTFPRKNKLSGEYVTDSKNYISIRDGKDAKNYLFFIHFEKKEGTCKGELKGTLQMKDDTTGIYNQSGDPCIIDFTFNGNEITLKEQGSCGNRRDMDCFFDDTFVKKSEPKKKKVAKAVI